MEVNKKTVDKVSVAISLIFIGTLFLLGNLGYITFKSVIHLFILYWPLLIVLAGVKLIVGAFRYGKIVNLVIDMVISVLITILLVLITSGSLSSFRNTDGWWNRIVEKPNVTSMSEDYKVSPEAFPLEKYKALIYRIEIGFGEFTMKSAEIDNYFEISGEYPDNLVEPVLITENDFDGNLNIGFRQDVVDDLIFSPWNWSATSTDFILSKIDKPTNLVLKVGAGDGDVDLRGLNLTKTDIDLAAGSLEVKMDSIPDEGLKLNVGAGNLSLYLPKGSRFAMKYSVGAGNLVYNEDGGETKSFGGLATNGSLNRGDDDKLPTLEINIGAGNVNLYLQ